MGGNYERELVNSLEAAGIPAMRAPSSGSATQRELPDIVAGMHIDQASIAEQLTTTLPDHVSDDAIMNASEMLAPKSEIYAIESKSQKGTTMYVDESEVKKLEKFTAAFGGKARLGARFTERRFPTEHFLVPPENARVTDSGRHGLPAADIKQRATEIVYPATKTQDARVEILATGETFTP